MKNFPNDIFKFARRKLGFLEDAVDINDLRIPPDNRLEALKRDRLGQHSIRINAQWRVCFRWKDGNAYDVELSTPGEVLKEEFLDPMGITPYALTKSIFVDPPRIAAIIKGKRKITADTALRLSKVFDNSADFWMNMQSRYELEILSEEKKQELSRISRFHKVS